MSWSCGDDAVPSIAFGDDDNEDAANIRFAQVDGAPLSVAKHGTGIDWIVLDDLICFLRSDLVKRDVVNVGRVQSKPMDLSIVFRLVAEVVSGQQITLLGDEC